MPDTDLTLTSSDPQTLEDKLFGRLCQILDQYLEPDQINDIVRAYHVGAKAHKHQVRKSGEAYICHPISVAITLAEMRMDARGIMAAILHDVIEDTDITYQQLADMFSTEVADLVEGVTKLTKLDNKSRAEKQAENVRKMFLAMAKDFRVIMVKLADRLHNMQTLGAMPADKKRRIAKETLEIYAPIANRLGMNKIRHQLEHLGFKALYPCRYKVLQHAVKKIRGHRKEIIDTIQSAIAQRLQQSDITASVEGGKKISPASIKKWCRKKFLFPMFLMSMLSVSTATALKTAI